jgi:ParB family chromosome partitioning protein
MSKVLREVQMNQIIPGDNDRTAFDAAELQKLADSIDQYGLKQPISLRPVLICPVCETVYGEQPFPARCVECRHDDLQERHQIVAGERRWRAHKLLHRDVIEALVEEMDDEQASGVMLLENIQRAELNPIEEARAYEKRMTQFGWDDHQVADKANVSVTRVRLRLALLDIVPEAQQLVRDGHMGIKYAYALRDLDDNRQRIALRYMREVENPNLKEFRQLCAELLAEQAQDALFDMAAFMTEIQEERLEDERNRPDRIIPLDDDLPAMRKASSIAQAIERYIKDLLDAGQEDAAGVVGTVYLGLLQHKLTKFPSGPSPLIPGETLN